MASRGDSAYSSGYESSKRTNKPSHGRKATFTTPARSRMEPSLLRNSTTSKSREGINSITTPSPAQMPIPSGSPWSEGGEEEDDDVVMQSGKASPPPLPPIPGEFGTDKPEDGLDEIDHGEAEPSPGSALVPEFRKLNLKGTPSGESRRSSLLGNFWKRLSSRSESEPGSSQAPRAAEDSREQSLGSQHTLQARTREMARRSGGEMDPDEEEQDPQTTTATSSPQDEESPPDDTGPEVELEHLLQFKGEMKLPSKLLRYRFRYVDLSTKESPKAFRKLLSGEIIGKLLPKDAVQIDGMTYVSASAWMIPDIIDPNTYEESKTRYATETIISANLVECEPQRMQGEPQAAGRNVTVGTKPDGKPDRKWLTLGNWRMVPIAVTPQQVVTADEVVKACDQIDHQGISIGLWFEFKAIPLNNARELWNMYQDRKSQGRTELELIIAHTLKTKLVQAGEESNHIVIHRNRAFANQIERQLSCGLVSRAGLEGELVHSVKTMPNLIYRPCSQLFYKSDQTVAEFIMAFVGQNRSPIDTALLSKVAKILKGLNIFVAVKDNFNKVDCIVKGLGESLMFRPESLHGLKANITLGDLKYPMLPCVDVGRSGRPFYFPTGLYTIKPDQVFLGEVPIVDHPTLFYPKMVPERNMTNARPDFTFSAGVDGFHLLFVNLVLPTASSTSKPLRQEVWNAFQYELG